MRRPPLTLTWVILIAYAIFENVLTEIPSALKKGVIYSLVGVLLIIIYFLIYLTAKLVVPDYSILLQSLISLRIFIIFTYLFFRPLHNTVQESIDKIFFSESYFSIVKENRVFSMPLLVRYTFPEPPKIPETPVPLCCKRITIINDTAIIICPIFNQSIFIL